MANRKELLESTRQQLRAIDKVVLDASNLSLSVRVDRLMDSAAEAYDDLDCQYDGCPCADEDHPDYNDEFDHDRFDLFDPIFHYNSWHNIDAARFQATITPDGHARLGYASSYSEVPDVDIIPYRDLVVKIDKFYGADPDDDDNGLADADVDEIIEVFNVDDAFARLAELQADLYRRILDRSRIIEEIFGPY